jgi:hypothetical protein
MRAQPVRDTGPTMSQENVEIVRAIRHRLALPSRQKAEHLGLDERIYVRFPAIYRRLANTVMRLPLRSRIRRWMLVRNGERATAAANRRDFDVLLLGFDPGIEYRPRRDWMVLDLDSVFHGHDGYRRMWQKMTDAFEDLRLEPEEILDLGDRLLVTARSTGHGSGSGVPVTLPLLQLFRLRRGLVGWQRDFGDRAEALEAAGLSEQ